MNTTTTTPPATCPECGRPAIAKAFNVASVYVRCSLGHVFSRELTS